MSFVTVSRRKNQAFVQAVLAQDAADLAAQEAEIARRVRQEVTKLRDKAEAEAIAGAQAAAQAELAPRQAALETAIAALQEATAQLAAPLAQKERDLADLVTELGFLLARHIIGAEATASPASLQALVTRLLDEAAAERGPRQSLRLRLNPADCAHLAAHLPADTAALCADDKIAPGGAVVELIAPEGDPLDRVEWDATLPGRLDAVRTGLDLPGPDGGAP